MKVHASAGRPGIAFTPAVFVALSSGLTGVSAAQLQTSDSCPDFVRLFHGAVADSVGGDTLDRLAHTFLSANTVTEGAADVLVDPDLGPVGRGIVRLWRTGVWHPPFERAHPPLAVAGEDYRREPVWRALQAHSADDRLFGPEV